MTELGSPTPSLAANQYELSRAVRIVIPWCIISLRATAPFEPGASLDTDPLVRAARHWPGSGRLLKMEWVPVNECDIRGLMPAIDPIRTQRLRIREFQPSDREALLSIVRDPSQIEHMLLFLETEQQLDEFLSMALSSIAMEPRLEWHFAVENLTTGQYLGSCCLMIEPSSTCSAELGYWFLREAWGRGYATESSAAMLELAFRRLGLHRVWGKCHVRNAASAKVMEKLGMIYEGTLREHTWLRDHYRSSRIYGMLASEYPSVTRDA